MVLYLGQSPRHKRLVSLVLNMYMDKIFPQFHFQHENFFEAVHHTTINATKVSQWKKIAGFVKNRRHKLLMHQKGSDTDPVIPEQEQQELPPQEYLKDLKASEGGKNSTQSQEEESSAGENQ